MFQRIQLSHNIYLDEFTASDVAVRHGIDVVIEPGSQHFNNCKRLAETILQPVRDHFKKPVVITSGYRPQELNRLVRGSQTSAHKDALAVDWNVQGVSPFEVCEWLLTQRISYDQLILEYNSWVHTGIKIDPAQHREQVLTAKHIVQASGKPKTQYFNGLIKE
jgi:zinc D-Ala-D-Ala carboxypeptidase